jgi:hypothetical protein
VSKELEEYLEPFLYEIAEDATKKTVGGRMPKPAEAAIGKLVLSAIRPEKQKNSVDFLKGTLLNLHNMQNKIHVGFQLGSMIRWGIKTFINIGNVD